MVRVYADSKSVVPRLECVLAPTSSVTGVGADGGFLPLSLSLPPSSSSSSASTLDSSAVAAEIAVSGALGRTLQLRADAASALDRSAAALRVAAAAAALAATHPTKSGMRALAFAPASGTFPGPVAAAAPGSVPAAVLPPPPFILGR